MNAIPALHRVEPRTVVLLLAGGLLLLATASWSLVFRDQVRDFRETRAALDTSRRDVTRERQGVDPVAIEAAAAAVRRLEGALYGAGPEVQVSRMAAHVIAALDGLAAGHDVRLSSVTPGPPAEVLGFTEVPFDVHAEGSYAGLVAWLAAAERSLHPMVVKRFRMQPAGGDDGRVLVELRVVSYRAPKLP